MNELLQKHGCANVFHVPEGLKELMSDISREVLRLQPKRLNHFIANYLSALLITREHGIMAMKILEDLCDCQPSVSEHLLHLGIQQKDAETLAKIIKEEIEESPEPVEGKEKVKEYMLLKKILGVLPMDEELSAQVCQVARNAYKDYWYRKNLLKQSIKMADEEPWEIAARNTLNMYKRTKPSLAELTRATEKIQAAYRGYHVRRHVLRHLLPKKDKRQGRKVDLSGPPLDIAGSRDVGLGPIINIRSAVKEDNVAEMFDSEAASKLGIAYDPMKTITDAGDSEFLREQEESKKVLRPPGLAFAGLGDKDDKFADETPEVDHVTLPAAEKTRSTLHPGPYSGRISFSEIPPEVIEDLNIPEGEDDGEIPDETGTTVSAQPSARETGDITDELPVSGEDVTDASDITGENTPFDDTDAAADAATDADTDIAEEPEDAP